MGLWGAGIVGVFDATGVVETGASGSCYAKEGEAEREMAAA